MTKAIFDAGTTTTTGSGAEGSADILVHEAIDCTDSRLGLTGKTVPLK